MIIINDFVICFKKGDFIFGQNHMSFRLPWKSMFAKVLVAAQAENAQGEIRALLEGYLAKQINYSRILYKFYLVGGLEHLDDFPQ